MSRSLLLLAVVCLAACQEVAQETTTDTIRSVGRADSLPVPTPNSTQPASADSTTQPSDSTVPPDPRAEQLVDKGARVTVCADEHGDTTTYHYKVTNGGIAPLRVWDLGLGRSGENDARDLTFNPDGGGELRISPFGLDPKTKRIGPSGAGVPEGWYAEWDRVEETYGYVITWHARSNEYAIAPGETRGWFSVSIPGSDSGYVVGHWGLMIDSPQGHAGKLTLTDCIGR